MLSLAEMEVGVLRSSDTARRAQRLAYLQEVRDALVVLPVDEPVASAYALLTATSRQLGRSAPALDTLIAATADAHGLTLITRDVAQSRLPGIDVMLLPPA